MTKKIAETSGRVLGKQIRNIAFREPEGEWKGLSQRQWNVIKTWMCQERTIDRDALLRSLQFKQGDLYDQVFRIMNRHGQARILAQAVMWSERNQHLVKSGSTFVFTRD